MANVLSPINLIVLLAILFVAIDCERHEGEKFDLSKGDHLGSISNGQDEPNFLEKLSHHFIRGWHGLRGLFGRKSKRREENGYGQGVFGREEAQKPSEKEVTVNKEYPEPEAIKEYPSFSNHRPSAYKLGKDKHSHGQKESGQKEEEVINPEGNQGYPGGVDEKKDKKEGSLGYEEGTVKPFDQRNDGKKGRDFDKRSTDGSEMKDSGNDDTERGGPYEGHYEGSIEGTEEGIDGNESGTDEFDETRRFKRAIRRGSFRPRPHFRGRPFRRP